MPIKLTPRLMTATKYVRGGVLADVGTDHAYLPIFLCENGFLRAEGDALAVASDINAGPVERAALHIRSARLSDKIVTVQTDGLCGLEKYSPTDIIIFGMGGELIAAILEAAEWVRHDGVRLILQPMTHAERLCEVLPRLGFVITDNSYSEEGDRIYRTICADFLPHAECAQKHTEAELLLGAPMKIANGQHSLYVKFAQKHLATLSSCRDAKRRAGVDASEEDRLIAQIEDILSKGEKSYVE